MSAQPQATADLSQIHLVESDGIPLDSPWHHAAISLLIEILTWHWRAREDFYVGGNMFLYFSAEQARNRDYRGPDFFFVDGVNRFPPRPYWAVWNEGGRYPNLIIEFLSPTTATEDRTTKKSLYERTFHTAEYFCYDPDTRRLQGWRLSGKQRYRAIKPDKRGWMWSEQLGMWLGPWDGTFQGQDETWLRLYDKDGGLILLEAEEEREQRESEASKRQAAEEEVARLKARLAELEGKG